jgi:Ferritin-like
MNPPQPAPPKIQPRNVPAQRLVPLVVGNPVTTRMEDSVGNCYPGLEFDQRNFDRRFFPGLVFNFVDVFAPTDPHDRAGAHLVAIDPNDPALHPPAGASDDEAKLAKKLRKKLLGDEGTALSEGAWYVERIAQGGVTIELVDPDSELPLTAGVVWRLVRMLEPGEVSIVLARRRPAEPRATVELHGWRRRYIGARTGLLDAAYAPGELGQSLCSPWMHDFRDCACNYWPSNHPDIVIPETPLGAALPTGERADDPHPDLRVDWLRADRGPNGEVQAPGTYFGVRGAQIDHYEINRRWEKLAFVLHGRESSGYYRANVLADVAPFASALDLADHLVYTASVEHVLVLEYLYARYSVKTDDELRDKSRDLVRFATFARHELLSVAVSEMRHLRWANELLWTLWKNAVIPHDYPLPALAVAPAIPVGFDEHGVLQTRPRALRNLSAAVLDDFVFGERPSGALDGLYSRVVATLRQPGASYPNGMLELTEQIVADGVNHYATFEELRSLGKPFEVAGGEPQYSRALVLAPPEGNSEVSAALDVYASIVAELRHGYALGDAEERRFIPEARDAMTDLDGRADALGQKSVGIPFFS